jgi:LSD1 subclass zinc finger protein
MSIRTACPHCRSLFDLADDLGGKEIRCGACQAVFAVPPPRPRSVVPPPPKPGPVPLTLKPTPVVHRPHNNVPWIVGGGVACVALLTFGAVAVALLLRDRPRPNEQAANQPVEAVADAKSSPVAEKRPGKVAFVEKQPPVEKAPPLEKEKPEKPTVRPKEEDPVKRGELSREALDAVKRATVFLHVTLGNGAASGTGFFGSPEAPNTVLTNAHVVGMLSPASQAPRRIEVVINSGEKDEKRTTARVVAVDRDSDLAVLNVDLDEGLPRPLTVKSAARLRELDKVYVFGFPLGERLGREITVRPSSVSSLRKRNGVLDKIQVNGGMDPGNSGGPVVDDSGHVVGVAVSGIPGRLINFAIPGERVRAILNGGIAAMGVGQPFKEGAGLGVPVLLEMIDPRGQIKEVALDVWTGNPPPAGSPLRPPSETKPEPVPGDSERKRVPLTLNKGVARADVPLPPLPEGKVYWLQPTWLLVGGARRWASAGVYRPVSPLERRSVKLESRFAAEDGPRRVSISSTTRVGLATGGDSDLVTISTRAELNEQTSAASEAGTTLVLAYQGGAREMTVRGKPSPAGLPPALQAVLKTLRARVELDADGGVRSNTLGNLARVRRMRQGDKLIEFHEPIKQGLEALLLPLPNKTVSPKQTWKTRRGLGVETPAGARRVRLDLTCVYLGVRAVGGKDEAVIGVEGAVRHEQLSGRATGLMLVDVAAGLVKRVDLDVEVHIPAIDARKQKVLVRSALALRLERAP